MNRDTNAPLIMWLQGGPGGPSVFGLLVEHGPYFIDKNGDAHRRNVTWASKYGIVYVDNPVGTGFSFTNEADSCYSLNQNDIAEKLYIFLQQFYKLFPNLQRNPFYVMGESYGGKYVPSVSYKIHVENQVRMTNKIKIPLTGMAIGDGFVDPPSMLAGYAPLLYQIGLLDENQRDVMEGMMAEAARLEREGEYLDSFTVFDEALNADIASSSYFTNCTGARNYFNFIKDEAPEEQSYFLEFLRKPAVRKMLHVGAKPFHSGTAVEIHLLNDFMQGVASSIEKLLDAGYRTLFYNGALDVIVGLPITERFLWHTLDWNGKMTYRNAQRKIWRISATDKIVAGYVRMARNLYQVGVRNAGHMVPFDQPERAFDMIDRFLTDNF